MELKDLNQLMLELKQRFNADVLGAERMLPKKFKDLVPDLEGTEIRYNKFTATLIQSAAGLDIYFPNQWFYIAAFMTDYYHMIKAYKEKVFKVLKIANLKDADKIIRPLQNNRAKTIELFDEADYNEADRDWLINFLSNYKWWGGGKSIDRNDFYVSPVLALAKLVNASQSFVADICKFLAEHPEPLAALKEELKLHPNPDNSNISAKSIDVLENIERSFVPYLRAMRTKPFLLLAGISGTGKSRIVRQLAKACWPVGSDEAKAHKPSNYEMIQVKPNWHDSSELLGYVSRIGDKPEFVAGDFLKFIAKAWEHPETPYFLCLDEMNLAPVEQYFAEYLSVVESRKLQEDGKAIKTDPILKKEDEEWYFTLTAKLTSSDEVRNDFNENGIRIPQNLIVVGTVNMDETTYSFSRKVLDRAMTIEMNEVNLEGGLNKEETEMPYIQANNMLADAVEGYDVYSGNEEVAKLVVDYLTEINNVLADTPFRIAYRTRNEFLIYVVNAILLAGKNATEDSPERNGIIADALDEVTSMKILSRIEGDKRKVHFLGRLKETIKAELDKIDGGDRSEEKSTSLAKLKTMAKRLDSGYTSFWD